MLPLPTVAARAVARAAKGETSPSSFFLLIFLPSKPAKISFMPAPRRRNWMNPDFMVSQSPTKNRMGTMTVHMLLAVESTQSDRLS
jgi:hypothetical protein